MLEKQVTYDHSITELGHIQVRQITRFMENGEEVGKSYSRHVVTPGDDTSEEDERTKAIALAIHTPEVVEAYLAFVAERMELENQSEGEEGDE